MEQPWYENIFAWGWIAFFVVSAVRIAFRKQLRRRAERAWHFEELAR